MAKKSNDNTILELKKQIKQKKEALKGIEKFVPITNCSLQLMGETSRFNLHVLSSDELTLLLVRLNSLKMSADNLKVKLSMGGFGVEDWISDVESKLLISNKKKEEERLKLLEKKLTDLLSVEKKTELLVEEIAQELI